MPRDAGVSALLRAGLATVGSWVGADAGAAPGATLISRNDAQVDADISLGLGRPRRSLVLQGGQVDIDDGPANLFDVIDDKDIWNAAAPVIVGASVTEGLHPAMAAAVVAIAARQTGKPRQVRAQHGRRLAAPGPTPPSARRLGDWLIERGRAADGPPLPAQELQYFVASGGWRALALSKTLDAARPERAFPEIIDVGGGIGLIAWLLATEGPREVQRVTIIDPNPHYRELAADLWSRGEHGAFNERLRIGQTTADLYRAGREVDLVLMCQTIYNIAREARPSVLERCWETLKPGGLLAINEIVLDDDASDAEATRRAHRQSPRRAEMIALLSRFGAPQLFRAHSDWGRAEDPRTVAARDCGSDSFLVVGKTAA